MKINDVDNIFKTTGVPQILHVASRRNCLEKNDKTPHANGPRKKYYDWTSFTLPQTFEYAYNPLRIRMRSAKKCAEWVPDESAVEQQSMEDSRERFGRSKHLLCLINRAAGMSGLVIDACGRMEVSLHNSSLTYPILFDSRILSATIFRVCHEMGLKMVLTMHRRNQAASGGL